MDENTTQGPDNPSPPQDDQFGRYSPFGVVSKNDLKAQEEWKQSADHWRIYVAEKNKYSRFKKLVLGLVTLGVLVSAWPMLKSFFLSSSTSNLARQQTEQRLAYLLTALDQVREARCELPSILAYIKTHPDSFHPAVLSLTSQDKLFQDGWGRPMQCRQYDGEKVSIRSAGPDGIMNTADDVTQEDLLARTEQLIANPEDIIQAQVAAYLSIKQMERIIGEFSEKVVSIKGSEDLFNSRQKAAETARMEITEFLSSITDENVRMRHQKCQDYLQYYLATLEQGKEAQEKINMADRQIQEMEGKYEEAIQGINLAAQKVTPDSDMAKLISDAKSQMVDTHSSAKKDLERLRTAAGYKLLSMSDLLQYEEEISKCYR